MATVVENLVTGETMQMTTSSAQRCRYDALLIYFYIFVLMFLSLIC